MLFITEWRVPQDKREAAVKRFKETGGAPPTGVKMIGRGHDIARRSGITLCEASDANAIAAWNYQWSDLLEMETYPVLEDADMAKVLSS